MGKCRVVIFGSKAAILALATQNLCCRKVEQSLKYQGITIYKRTINRLIGKNSYKQIDGLKRTQLTGTSNQPSQLRNNL